MTGRGIWGMAIMLHEMESYSPKNIRILTFSITDMKWIYSIRFQNNKWSKKNFLSLYNKQSIYLS